MTEFSSDTFDESAARQYLQERFDANLQILKDARSFILRKESDELKLDTIDWLVKLLRAGSPNQETLNLLANFLERVSNKASNSKSAWSESVAIASLVLGQTDNGRPTNAVREIEAIETFFTRTELYKDNESDALRAAYDAYFMGTGRNFEVDDRKIQKATKGSDEVEVTKAQIGIDKIILPILRKANLILPKPKGRKPKS